ncbi:serine/threonine-protein kinase [Nannocystaceae bacterium ST9]
MAVYERGGGFVRTIAPQLEAVGEQAVLDSETIEGETEASEAPVRAAAPNPTPSPSDDPDDRIGELIHGRYRLVRQLGRGGMGTVYLAEHATIPKTFAVKLLNRRYASRQDFAARFLLEAQAVSLIDHPNVVGVVDFGTTSEGATFLVMEHLRGEPLKALCRREAPLAWPRVRHLMLQICRALQAAHAVGIVHRDIKPDNVLRTTQGDDRDYVKVLDFGLAKIQTGDGLRLTRTGMVLGTPEYMAPEQARGSAIDHRVDIYAAGILLYELLCGRTPFQATTFVAMRNHHLLTRPEPPSRWAPNADITPEMDAIALRALAKDPDHRFASMTEMAEAIEAVGRGRGPVPLLERDTKPFGLTTASLIAERGRLNSTTRRTGELSAPAMDWARPPGSGSSTNDSSVALPRRRGPLVLLVLLGIGIGAAIVIVSKWPRERPAGPSVETGDPSPLAPSLAITPIEPTSAFVGLTLETNVPVRVLEARDQAIVGDTHRSSTLALPRSSEPMKLLLRAEGYRDLAIEVIPDRERSASYTLELAPAKPAPVRASEPEPIESPIEASEPPSETDESGEPSETGEPSKDNRFAPEIRDPWETPR